MAKMGERPLGQNLAYTRDEVDALLAAIASGAPAGGFTNAAPLSYSTPAITAQSDGQVIGLTPDGLEIYQPRMVGGIPVKVNGKEYLIPLVER